MIPRRTALERLSLMLGGALSTQVIAALRGEVLNAGTSVPVSEAQTKLLAELADVIIPTTDTPGAKAAGVESFIIRVMQDCYLLADQELFYAGLAKIDEVSRETHGKDFIDLDAAQQIALMSETTKTNKPFFKQLKELTVTGYFISEIGATQALVYLPVPGRFEGDVPLPPGQKAWAISR